MDSAFEAMEQYQNRRASRAFRMVQVEEIAIGSFESLESGRLTKCPPDQFSPECLKVKG